MGLDFSSKESSSMFTGRKVDTSAGKCPDLVAEGRRKFGLDSFS